MGLRKLAITAVSVFALLMSATAPARAGDKVIVENTSAQAVPVKDVGKGKAAGAFQAQVTLNLADGVSGANGTVAIPAGKRLVIEYASAWAQAPGGEFVSFSVQCMLNGETVFTPHYLPVSQQYLDVVNQVFIAGTAVQLYADTPQVNLRVDRGSNVAGPVTAFISISGHLVDAPQ